MSHILSRKGKQNIYHSLSHLDPEDRKILSRFCLAYSGKNLSGVDEITEYYESLFSKTIDKDKKVRVLTKLARFLSQYENIPYSPTDLVRDYAVYITDAS